MEWSLVLSLASLALSAYAVYRTTALEKSALTVAAADRALDRFSRFNEILFQKPELNEVFFKSLTTLRDELDLSGYATAKGFAWFVLNQMEGVYMDRHYKQLSPVSFQCYDTWLKDRLRGGGALRDFLEQKDQENLKYFAEPYQKYLRQLLKDTRAEESDAT